MVRTGAVIFLVLLLVVAGLPLAMMTMGDSATCPECDAAGGHPSLAMCAAILAVAAFCVSAARGGSLRTKVPSVTMLVLVTGLDRPPRAV